MWRRWIYAVRARLRAIVRSERSDRELSEELSFHIAMETEDNVSRGMSRVEAERHARLEQGLERLGVELEFRHARRLPQTRAGEARALSGRGRGGRGRGSGRRCGAS